MSKKLKYLNITMAAILLISAFLISQKGAQLVSVFSQGEQSETITVLIDAGHGGYDPGKVGVNDAQEKDINLAIATLLKEKLEKEGITVVMTRESDAGLYDENAGNKKVQDLQRRCDLINETNPIMAVSIHQNSYEDPSVNGAQVFYHSQSEKGEQIATILQNQLNEGLEDTKDRAIKGNTSYYILTESIAPTVIVECGFLSNPAEADRLVTEAYQEEFAEQLKLGILEYIRTTN